MKALVVRPNFSQIEESVIKNEVDHPVYKLMRNPILWKINIHGAFMKSLSAISVYNKLTEIGVKTDAMDMLLEFGIVITERGIIIQNDQIKNVLEYEKYDLICISCSSCQQYLPAKRLVDIARKTLPKLKIIIGGYHASCDPLDIITSIPGIDVVVIGDFEPIADSLVSALKTNTGLENIPNLYYRKDNKIVTTQRRYFRINYRDYIPNFPSSGFDKYIPYYAEHLIEGSRGCLYNKCGFCAEPFLRNYYIHRPVDQVLDEMEYTVKRCKEIHGEDEVVFFLFSDPLWGGSPSWAKEFCYKLKERKKKFQLKIKWEVEMRVDQKITDLFPIMVETGCIGFSFGVESVHPKILRSMNKCTDYEHYYQSILNTIKAAIKATRQVEGCWVEMNIIVGWPGEELKDLLHAFEKITKIKKEIGGNLLIFYFPVAPLPGTKLWEMVTDNDFKNRTGLKMIFPLRYWKEGYFPFVPMLNASKTLSAASIADFATHKVVREPTRIIENPSVWLSDKSFEQSILTKDIIPKEEIYKYSNLLRTDNNISGPDAYFINAYT